MKDIKLEDLEAMAKEMGVPVYKVLDEIVMKEKKNLLLTLYSFEEILDILGYYEGSGNTAWDEEVQEKLEKLDSENEGYTNEFIDIVMGYAINNGNFEEALQTGVRLPI